MRLSVRLFARARDLAGAPSVELDVPDRATVEDLRKLLVTSRPTLAPLAGHLLIAVGSEYAADSYEIRSGDDVACFPPVSGG